MTQLKKGDYVAPDVDICAISSATIVCTSTKIVDNEGFSRDNSFVFE